MRAVLISTYELGRQPLGLASPAAWLRKAGWEVVCADVSRQQLQLESLVGAELIAFHLPMHTATRLALQLIPQIKAVAPQAHLCCFGLYAAMNEDVLRGAGADSLLSGEFEGALMELAQRIQRGEPGGSETLTVLDRLEFITPDRTGLPRLEHYAKLQMPSGASRVAGYTEASRGCKHTCRHCPIVPVYQGRFRILPVDVALADIRQQIEMGAEHISFGDPDFFNSVVHAGRVVTAMHREFPHITFDATIKVEHLLRHADSLALLRETGCVLITSAVESFDDAVLRRLEKGHTRADFLQALRLVRNAGIGLNPTFVSFTPWTTRASYYDLCRSLVEAELESIVAPVQLGVRLLVPAGSRMLDHPDRDSWVGEYDASMLCYRWLNPDPAVDELAIAVQNAIGQAAGTGRSRADVIAEIATLAAKAAGKPPLSFGRESAFLAPFLNEPWFCCSEPTDEQFARLNC